MECIEHVDRLAGVDLTLTGTALVFVCDRCGRERVEDPDVVAGRVSPSGL